jgi:VWFA-related protein
VVLDVVVRDRKGNLVLDLDAADFEVREDGRRQSLGSFQILARSFTPAPAPSPVAPAASVESPATVSTREVPTPVLAFVFDRMSATGRDLARRAAMAYVAAAPPGATLIGVFAIDLAVHTVQPYTLDRALLPPALERAASFGNTSFASATTRAESRERFDTTARADTALRSAVRRTTSTAGQGARATASLGAQTALARAQAEFEVRLQRNLEFLERTQQGYATLSALRAVVGTLAKVPGRKTVVLFSEGLALPANVEPSFRALVASANEASVSFYAMDAGGLRIASPTQETADELRQAGERRLRQMEGAGDLAVDASLTKQLERSEDLLRLDPRSGLGQLADQTGGFLIRDSNDAASSLLRVGEDMRFHYVLAYAPTNERLDGRFRSIAVRVRRRGVKVQARKGYVATPGSTWSSGS